MAAKHLEELSLREAGIAPEEVEGFLRQIEEKQVHLHSFMMLKGNRVFAQGSYAPCRREDLHMLFSMSKSFTSTAIGFAVQEKRLALTDRAADFFREELREGGVLPDARMERVTIRHLLTMNTGQTDPGDATFRTPGADWVIDFFSTPAEKEPGSWFCYNTRATYILSVILQKVTGQRLFDYLKPRLFEPLGFSENIWWEVSPQGYNTGGFGLNISVEDLAKFGIFVKDRGRYAGKQLLSAAWFEEATRCWSDTSNTWEGESGHGYGYQFWMCHIPGVYRGDGAFGQYCVVMPERDMLFCATAGELDMQRILDAFWNNLYEKKAQPLSAYAKEDALRAHIKRLTLPAYYREKGIQSRTLALPDGISGKRYRLEENVLHITGLCFREKDGRKDACWLELWNGENRDVLEVTADAWTPAQLRLDGAATKLDKYVFRAGLFPHCHVKGCTENGVFYMDMFFEETSFQDTWEVRFQKDALTLSVKRNTGFEAVDFTVRGTCL